MDKIIILNTKNSKLKNKIRFIVVYKKWGDTNFTHHYFNMSQMKTPVAHKSDHEHFE